MPPPAPIVLFTDFGPGPYVGQMKAVLWRLAPEARVIDLFDDAPAHDPMLSAYLLAAYGPEMPDGAVILAIVDPGVGGKRAPVAVEADGRWYVGPDNGLMVLVARRAKRARAFDIAWRPDLLSASFHGRDLFAPVAAGLAMNGKPPGAEHGIDTLIGRDWPDDLPRIVYIDRFGNAMTGLRAANLDPDTALVLAGRRLTRARTFSDLPVGTPFWYENANGLAEIAVNQGRADRVLAIGVGDTLAVGP